jgi:hypothetical protein
MVITLVVLSGCAGTEVKDVIVTDRLTLVDRSGPPPENNWQIGRKAANKLGDAADAGNKAALAKLTDMAENGDAPAAHNLGWYYSRRKNGRIEDNTTSCDWYRQSSKRRYVPSLHQYAFRCLMPKTPRGGPALKKEMVQNLLDAAHYGWVPSALYVSEYIMNSRKISQRDAAAARQAVKNGLKSNPNPKEKTILNYLLGMTTMYSVRTSSKEALQAYREAETGLRQAADKKYGDSIGQLPVVRIKWGEAVYRGIVNWSPPSRNVATCQKFVTGSGVDKASAQTCFTAYVVSKIELKRLEIDAIYLTAKSGRSHMRTVLEKLKTKTAAFKANQKIWEGKFVSKFMERKNTDSWTE